MNSKKQSISTFEDLKVWQTAHEIGILILTLTKGFPSEEKYRLKDQMLRSSRSISDNLAEGFGRFHYQENIQFCRISRGSAYELINQLITAYDCNYINEATFNTNKRLIIECVQLLNGYIRYLQRAKKENISNEDIIPYLISSENNESNSH